MMVTNEPSPGEVTELLIAFRDGDKDAFHQLVPLLYEELRRVARHQIARHRPGVTLDATGLVHEIYMKMADQNRLGATDRSHFLAIAARAMRQVIVDRARRRTAAKRGGDVEEIPIDDAPEIPIREANEMVELDDALTRLAASSPRLAQVVECRFFAGYSEEETAKTLDISVRSVQRDWMRARAWLKEELGSPLS